MTFEQIQYVAGIYANLRDSLPKRYRAELHFSFTPAYICILDARTYHTVLRHTWEEGDTASSFEASLEARLQNTILRTTDCPSSSVDDV